jgi:hypothetical protein
LTENDLANIKNIDYYHGACKWRFYMLLDVRLLAIQKKFDIHDPNLDQYILCLDTILDENKQVTLSPSEQVILGAMLQVLLK